MSGFAAWRSQVLLGQAAYLQRHGRPAKAFHDMMIEEGHAALDRVRHLHAVAEEVQDVGREKRFGPDEKRLVQWVAPVEHGGYIEAIEEEVRAVAAVETRLGGVAEQA